MRYDTLLVIVLVLGCECGLFLWVRAAVGDDLAAALIALLAGLVLLLVLVPRRRRQRP